MEINNSDMKFTDLSITLHTDKLRECVDFYKKYFHAKVTFDDGEWYVVIRLESYKDTPPIYLSFQGDNEQYGNEHFSGGVSLNLKTKDVDACYKRFKDAGIVFTEDITNHEWGDRAFSIKDPIGVQLYIYSDREIADKYKDAIKE